MQRDELTAPAHPHEHAGRHERHCRPDEGEPCHLHQVDHLETSLGVVVLIHFDRGRRAIQSRPPVLPKQEGLLMNNVYCILLILFCLNSILLFAQENQNVQKAVPALPPHCKLAVFPEMYKQQIRTILLMPPQDDKGNSVLTVAQSSLAGEELNLFGYYTIPYLVGEQILKKEQYQEGQQLSAEQLEHLKKLYQVDAVMYMKTSDLQDHLSLLDNSISVLIHNELVSTSTASIIWQYSIRSTVNGQQVKSLAKILDSKHGYELADLMLRCGFQTIPHGFYSPNYHRDAKLSSSSHF
jgi:hypothetical protein